MVKSQVIGLFLAAGALVSGCAPKASVRRPLSPFQKSEKIEKRETQQRLEGVWENRGRKGRTNRMTFEAGGALTFDGGLDYLNPGQWELDDGSHELRITLPRADDEKMQIFVMYIGDGVKAVNREQKQVTYPFNAETASLNVSGWIYTRTEPAAAATSPPAEPIFK